MSDAPGEGVKMPAQIIIYRIYDVAEEINLATARQLLSDSQVGRMQLGRVRPKSMQIKNPPLLISVGEDHLEVAGLACRAIYKAKIFDLGVISLALRLYPERPPTYTQLLDLAAMLQESDLTGELLAHRLTELRRLLGPAMQRPGRHEFVEDYTVFCFPRWPEEWDAVPLLLAEREPISQQTRQQVLANSFSYGPNDLAIITWDSALVVDDSGSYDIPDLLEFANMQLLELRYYDNLLSQEMDRMYQEIEDAERFSGFGRRRHYRKIMNRLMELLVDISDIHEKIHNSLKVTEDIFYARVYSAALSIFRTHSWAASIDRKISLIQQSYTMLSDEITTWHSTLLELTIVFLILLELILGLVTLHG
ncbi:hypothetical protein [Desulfurispora thermophila]|uniref:hypothetical protein n=1 Tax=Desulfurispora thermophila TaxID=265470 RepID=UPI00035E8852|nr:hypothetical protein [Desulfurispora thermophila]